MNFTLQGTKINNNNKSEKNTNFYKQQMSSSVTIERKRIDCSALPKGWQREEVVRKSGISPGKVDVFYYSPTGKKIESKPQLARELTDANIDISTFDFQTGKIIQHLPLPSISLYRCNSSTVECSGASPSSTSISAVTAINALKRKSKSSTATTGNNNNNNNNINLIAGSINTSSSCSGSTNLRQQLEFSRAIRPDVSLVPPIRQTASIFKQPVTVVRNHENTKVKHDTKHQGAQEKPKQLFWEKRLEHLRACHATGEEFDEILPLPKSIRSLGPNVDEQTVLQSLATALHVLNGPVTGQTSTKTEFIKNATAFINPEQPLMQSVLISEDDIRRQEDRVNVARKKLQEALKA